MYQWMLMFMNFVFWVNCTHRFHGFNGSTESVPVASCVPVSPCVRSEIPTKSFGEKCKGRRWSQPPVNSKHRKNLPPLSDRDVPRNSCWQFNSKGTIAPIYLCNDIRQISLMTDLPKNMPVSTFRFEGFQSDTPQLPWSLELPKLFCHRHGLTSAGHHGEHESDGQTGKRT